MNEIQKPNDIFVSTIINPQAKVTDLLANGINAENTNLLAPEVYKESEFVKKQYTDKFGNFDNERFTADYKKAVSQFGEMTSYKSYEDLQNILLTYDQNDIFAPLNANFRIPSYEIKKVKNPYKTTKGISSLYGEGERKYSNRELAQQHLVKDSETGEWLNYTAEDRGLFGWITKSPLVYATYDEDGWYDDPSIGRKVFHRKGEFKTDENGEFYCETAGNRELYGKQFVAISDTLTKEDSWLNKVDIFDSDGLNKSIGGTTMKFIAQVAPYMIPTFNVYYGGVTAAINLLSVMPTFAKALEGIITGDTNSSFSQKMTIWENYFHNFDDSYSDDATKSNWDYEKMATMISDVFAQLYQMRAMSSLSLLKNIEVSKDQSKLFQKFSNDFAESYFRAASDPKSKLKPGIEGMVEWWNKMAPEMPEIKALLDKRSKLAKSLSLGYMALTSSADVYSDAIKGGYDPRMAGIAAIVATTGQYALMCNNRMGDWFLDATTGYKEGISKKVMKDIMKEYYDVLEEGTRQLGKEVTKEGKMKILSSIYDTVYNKGIKGFFNIIKDGGEEFWKKSIIEGVEEVTEEAVMDMTKGVFDTLSWLGIGRNSETATFGGWNNVFSEEGLTRYVQSLVGGMVGGALFEFQGNVIEPGIRQMITGQISPEVKASIVREVALGHTAQLKEATHKLCSVDNGVNAQILKIDGDNAEIGKFPNITTRGQLIEQRLNKFIDEVDAIIGANKAKMTDQQIFSKFLRDETLIPMIEESEIHKMILKDFNRSVSELVDAQQAVTDEEAKGKEGEVEAEKLKTLKETLKEKKQIFEDFVSGKNSPNYVKAALQYLHPYIRQYVLNMDKYSFTQGKYGKSYNDPTIPDKGTGLSRESIDKEYEEWKESKSPEQKFLQYVVPAYDNVQRMLSGVIKEYAKVYANTRVRAVRELLSDSNEQLAEMSEESVWRQIVGKISRNLSNEKKPGVTLQDIFKLDDEFINQLVDELLNDHYLYLNEFAQAKEISLEDAKKIYATQLKKELESYPALDLDKKSLDGISHLANAGIAATIFRKIKADNENKIDKTIVDSTLVRLGFSPLAGEIDSEQQLLDYFASVVSPRFSPDIVIDLRSTGLEKYLTENFLIDNEMLVPIKRALFKAIQAKEEEIISKVSEIQISEEILDPYDPDSTIQMIGQLSLTDQNMKTFYQKLKEGLDQNQPIEQIIEDFLFNPDNGIITLARLEDKEYQFLESKSPNVSELIKQTILKIIETPWTGVYESSIAKYVIKNPLLELLRKFSFEVSGESSSNLFELLESEWQHISQLQSTEDYLRFGITYDQIDNFIKLLELFEAVVYGSEQVDQIGMENPIAYNQQMQRFYDEFGKDLEKPEGLYETIDTNAVTSLIYDLELLKNKLQMLQNLIRANKNSQIKDDQNTKKKHEDLILNHLLNQAGSLTLKGVSILPPKDEIDKRKTVEEKLFYIEHEIKVNFDKIAKEDRKEAIVQLFDQLGFDRDHIIKSNLNSYGLNPQIEAISQSDLFVYWATLLSTDQSEFALKYQDLLSQDWYKHVPKYIQKFAIKVGYAFYADKDGIHDMFVEELFKNNTLDLNRTSQIYFLNGITGSGKTSNVAKGIYYMLNPDETVYVVGPNDNQANNLKSSLTSGIESAEVVVLNKLGLLNIFLTDETITNLVQSAKDPDNDSSIIKTVEVKPEEGTKPAQYKYSVEFKDDMIKPDLKKSSKIPSVIFIDEITHFTSAELQILDKIGKKFGIKFFTFGDTLQDGALIGNINSNINYIFRWSAPRLLLTTRAQNIHSKDNIDLMSIRLRMMEDIITEFGVSSESNRRIKDLINQGLTLKYFESSEKDELHGHKLVKSITKEDIEQIVKACKKASEKTGKKVKFGIIANMDGDDLKDKRFENMLKSLGLKNGEDYVLYSPDPKNLNHAVQGAESEYFIIKDFNISSKTDIQKKLTVLYTYLTRSLSGTIAAIPQSLITSLGISNKQYTYTDMYVLPGTENAQSMKKDEISRLEKLLEDYTPTKPTTPKKVEPKKVEPAEEKKKVEIKIEHPEDEAEEEKPFEEASEEELKEADKERSEAEIRKEEGLNVSQETVEDNNTLNNDPFALWGISSYLHLGLERKDNNNEYCTSNGISLDFDGLIPPTVAINARVRAGMAKLKNLIAFYPDSDSQEFKSGFFDYDILELFYKINPNWALDEDGKLPEDLKSRLRNIYDKLIGEDILKVEKKAYIFGKEYNSEIDRARGFFTYDASKEIQDGAEPLILYGYRIYTDKSDGTLNQYISIGSFPKKENVQKFAKNIPNGPKIIDEISKQLESKKLAVLALKTDKFFTPRTQLRIIKSENPNDFFSISKLQASGVIFDENQFGLITSSGSNDKFDFLEFKAKYESNGDEDLEAKKLEQFYKPVEEGGFILIEKDEDGKEVQKLACAGNYFVPVSYTRGNTSFRQILILEPKSKDATQMIAANYDDRKRAIGKNPSETAKNLGKTLTRARRFSVYSQTNLVLSILDQLGAFDDDGNEVTIEGQSIAKKYIQATFDEMNLLLSKGGLTDLEDFDPTKEFLESSSFSRNHVKEFLEQTKLFGLFFLDTNIVVNDNDDILIRDQFSSDKSRLIEEPLDFTDFKVRVNFTTGKKVFFKGYNFEYLPIKFSEKKWLDYEDLGLSGHSIQMSLFNIGNDMLESYSVYEKPLTHKDIDYSILNDPKVKQDRSSEDFKEQATHFNEDSVKLQNVEVEVDSDAAPEKKKNTKGEWYQFRIHIQNKFGWDISIQDKVQIYGNEKQYEVNFIYKKDHRKYGKVQITDGENEWDVPVDAISRVVSRIVRTQYDKQHDYYRQKGWIKKALEKVGRKADEKAHKELIDKKSKIVSDHKFDPSDLDYEDLMYVAIPFNADEDYQEVLKDPDKSWTFIQSEEEMSDLINSDSDIAGYTILKLNKWKSKTNKIPKFDPLKLNGTEVRNEISTLVRKNMEKNQHAFAYIQNVVLFKSYEAKIPGEEEVVENKASKKELKKEVKKPYMDGKYDSKDIAALDIEHLPVFDSLEDAKQAGFFSSIFFFEKQKDGKIKVIPNADFYKKEGIKNPTDDQPKFNIGDRIFVKSTLTTTSPEHVLKEKELVGIENGAYILRDVETNRKYAYDIISVNTLIDHKYFSQEGTQNDIKPKNESGSDGHDSALPEIFNTLGIKINPDNYSEAVINALSNKLSELNPNPQSAEILIEMVNSALQKEIGLDQFLDDVDLDYLEELAAQWIQLTEEGKNPILVVSNEDGDIDFTFTEETECL